MAGPEKMELKKQLRFTIDNDSFTFRFLSPEDVTESYVEALRRQRFFLTNNPVDINLQWQQDYVKRIQSSASDTICGLFLNSELIATTGIQNIRNGEMATIGIFVLDETLRGRGFGKTAVWSACYLIKELFEIIYFGAGVKKTNIASSKLFLACGFKVEREGVDNLKLKLKVDELVKPGLVKEIVIE